MAYDSGFLNKRIDVLNRDSASSDDFSVAVGGSYIKVATIWANVTHNKGMKSLREGAIEAYDTCMVRCRPNPLLNRESRLQWGSRTYQITSLNEDPEDNSVQILCTELQ